MMTKSLTFEGMFIRPIRSEDESKKKLMIAVIKCMPMLKANPMMVKYA